MIWSQEEQKHTNILGEINSTTDQFEQRNQLDLTIPPGIPLYNQQCCHFEVQKVQFIINRATAHVFAQLHPKLIRIYQNLAEQRDKEPKTDIGASDQNYNKIQQEYT